MSEILTPFQAMNQTNNINAKSPQALQGVRVLDLTRILAGPWCTQTLADLGADVIKIERPAKDASEGQGGDDTRRWGPPFLKDKDGHDSVESAYFMCANRNKRSVTCDISQPAGQALIRKLVMQCDVLVENFKVGDLARYGLDYASLSKFKPSLVYCSITGFGQTGPYKDRAGYDYAVQAMGGLMSVTGERDDVPGGGPQKVGVAVADLFTGLNSVIGILAALRHAERTGQGQQVDIALLDTQVSMLANLGAQYLSNGEVPKRLGNAHANIVPYQVFEVAPSIDLLSGTPQKEYIILAVGNDNQFAKFCQVAGQPDIAANPKYTKNQDRVTNREELVPLLGTILKSRSKEDWLSALQAVHVPCGPINNFDDVFKDPQVLARNMVTTYPHPIAGEVQLVANPLKLSATPVSTNRAPPLCGQHTEEVLQELLNCSDTDVEQWRRDGVV